jgi:hypothetical protein
MRAHVRGVALAVVAGLALGAGGCGTTMVMTNEPTARVFADGRLIGKGQGEIDQRGTPGSTTVTVQAEDGRRGQTVISRRFTGFTFLTGLFTYGICFFACWEYPSSVMVMVPPPQYTPAPGYAAPPGVDPWLMPPPGWRPKSERPN